MKEINYNVQVNDARLTCVDALLNKSIFEYKARVNDLRLIQSTILQIARMLSELPDHTCVLIIDQTRISQARLRDEWQSLLKLIQPAILERIRMVIFSKGSILEQFGDLQDHEINALNEIREKLNQIPLDNRHRKQDAFFEILRILLVFWFRGSGPLKVSKLGQLSGFSYPTIASVINKLDDKIIRHSDRSVELRSFPQNDWVKFLTKSEEIRPAFGYWAYRPKSMEDILKRLMERTDHTLALGGIVGARHYYPGIDLVGIHRLDLSVLNWNIAEIELLIRELDPGLKKSEPGTIPQVAVHKITRPEPLFINGKTFKIADEVECLLDLNEARLETPFFELLEHFKGCNKQ